MTSYDTWKSTNPADAELGPSPLSQEDERSDAINALQVSGMEPMETAPRNREITVVLDTNLVKVRAFWHDDIFAGGCWMDANGDGAPDSVWRHWNDDELMGWLPAGEVKP